MVTVQAQGHLRLFRPDGHERFTLELPGGATLRDLIDLSQIPWEEVGLAALNGSQAPDETPLQHGDEVLLFAPLEGG